ncbi:nitroreductase family protein [Bacillus solitudinis]|uniref:nitroreductase family protein n=1 Tax=Bacillus solitudinis TaxID=2014074 RepID=UPI000C24B61C|nr:nitroreductase [Bacillus solitudinis]
MNVMKLLKSRRAIRNYEPRHVEKEKIEQLLEAATLAPNDRMREPWSFYVIQGEAKDKYVQLAKDYLEERFQAKPKLVESSLKVVTTTPAMIVVASDIVEGDDEATRDNEYAVCCAIHSMWLMAMDLDLGFVWRTRGVGLVSDARMNEFIGSLQNKKIIGTVYIGYPDQEALDKLKPKTRIPFSEKTTWL